MRNIIEIKELSLPELEVYAHLAKTQPCKEKQAEKALLIVESVKVISCALDAGCEALSFLMARRHIEGSARALLERCPNVAVYTAEEETLCALTGFSLTRGVLCAMKRPRQASPASICKDARRIAILESVADPTNIGAIFRSAAALNVDAVLLTPSCGDPLYRRALRVSMGTVFQLPWTRVGGETWSWPEGCLLSLKELGFSSVAMALDDRALNIDDPQLASQKKLAIILGAEGDGISQSALKHCEYIARIPMARGVDSLNVAAASAVAFWQLCRR